MKFRGEEGNFKTNKCEFRISFSFPALLPLLLSFVCCAFLTPTAFFKEAFRIGDARKVAGTLLGMRRSLRVLSDVPDHPRDRSHWLALRIDWRLLLLPSSSLHLPRTVLVCPSQLEDIYICKVKVFVL